MRQDYQAAAATRLCTAAVCRLYSFKCKEARLEERGQRAKKKKKKEEGGKEGERECLISIERGEQGETKKRKIRQQGSVFTPWDKS